MDYKSIRSENKGGRSGGDVVWSVLTAEDAAALNADLDLTATALHGGRYTSLHIVTHLQAFESLMV